MMYHSSLDAIAQSIALGKKNLIINHKLTSGHLMKAGDLQLRPTPMRDVPDAERKLHLWQAHCDGLTPDGTALYRFTNAQDDTAMAIDPMNPRGGIVYQESRPADENSREAYAQRWLLIPIGRDMYAMSPALHADHALAPENKDLKNNGCFRGSPIDDGDLPGYLHGVSFNTDGGQKDPQCSLGGSSNNQNRGSGSR